MPNRPPTIHSHITKGVKRYDNNRLSPSKRGYGYKWSVASAAYLRRNRLCVMCLAVGRHRQATQTDHIVPHKGNRKLLWDRKNWQALCGACHGRKTREEGKEHE